MLYISLHADRGCPSRSCRALLSSARFSIRMCGWQASDWRATGSGHTPHASALLVTQASLCIAGEGLTALATYSMSQGPRANFSRAEPGARKPDSHDLFFSLISSSKFFPRPHSPNLPFYLDPSSLAQLCNRAQMMEAGLP